MFSFSSARSKRTRGKKIRSIGNPLGRRVHAALEPLEERALMAVFQGGDLVVLRVGDGSSALVNTGDPIFLDEYTPSGTLVQSIAMPTMDDGTNHALIDSGVATTDGGISRSADGQYLITQGFNVDYPPGADTSITKTTGPRTVGRVDIAGNVDTTTEISTFPSGKYDNARSAVSVDGTGFWFSGGKGGIVYVPLGASDGVGVTGTTDTTSYQQLSIFDGQLYVSNKGSGTVGTVGTGLPTGGPQTVTNLPGLPLSSNTEQFVFMHLNGPGSAPDTLYVTDDTLGEIQKWSLVAGNWVSNGAVAATAIRGLTGYGDPTTGKAVLFGVTGGTSGTGGGSLYAYTDDSGYNAAPTGSVTTIATAGYQEAFRTVAFAPNTAPVLDTSVHPALDGILEDVSSGSNPGTLVSDIVDRLGGSKINDPGQLAQGIAVTAVNNSNGTWQYSLDNGSSWLNFGAPSSTSARLLPSDSSTRVRFLPNANVNGTITPGITFRAWDRSTGDAGGTEDTTFNGSYSAFSTATNFATLAITPVNDAPSFTRGSDQAVVPTAGAQSIPNWATAISPGPSNESGQAVNFVVTGNTNPAIFSAAPAISPTGTLTYTPSGVSGTAVVTIALHDNGGTANGGVDTSASQTITFNFYAVGENHPPFISASLAAQTMLEDTPLVLSSGNGNQVSFTDSDALSGDNEQITLTLTGGTASLSTLSGLTGSGNGTTSMTYTGTVASLNAALNGLTFTPSANLNGNGAGSIQLVVSDLGHNGTGGTKTDTATIAVNITPVNDAPSFAKGANESVAEDSGAQSFANWATSILAGPANESGQMLDFIVSNDNNALFSVQPTITSAGTLSFTPAADANGSTTVTVQLHDDGGTANGGIDTSLAQTFTINVTPVNDPPVNQVPNRTIRAVENVPYVFSNAELNAVSVSDVDANGASEQITLTATHGTLTLSSLAGLSGSGDGTALLTYTGSLVDLNAALDGLTFTPTNGYTGSAAIQITTNDLGNTGGPGPQSTVTPINLNVVAPSPLLINELFFNPPGSPDNPNDYIELRSLAPNYTIPNGTYLISLNSTPVSITDSFGTTVYPVGTVFETFDLSGDTTGSNGMLVILQKDNPYVAAGLIDPNAAVLDNTGLGTGAGYGNNYGFGGSSIVGHSAIVRSTDINLIKPSSSYMLIQTNTISNPVYPGDVLDAGGTGTLHGTEFSGFTVFDAVGALTSGAGTPGDIGYGYLNFSDANGITNVFTPDSQPVVAPFTAAYIGRTGDTLGWQASDWVASDNLGGTLPTLKLGGASNTAPESFAHKPLNHIGSTNFASNAPPTVTTTASPLVYSPTSPVVADPGVAITDTDSSFLVGATVQIAGYVNGEDQLTFIDTPNITGSFDMLTGILTLSGIDSAANYQAALQSITYSNSNVSATNRVLLFTADDGNISAIASRSIKINNQAPHVDLSGAAGDNFNSIWTNAGAIHITDVAGATVTDPDDTTLTSMTAVIVSGTDPNNVLAASAIGNITPSFVGNTLTLSGTDSLANYQAVLRSITYNNTAGGPGSGTVTVDISASDGLATSNLATATISIGSGSSIAARNVFYNNSYYDGNTAGISASDDGAIAPDKAAFNGVGTAPISAFTSYSRGINGLMVDIAGTHGTLTTADFAFKIGTNNVPNSWATAPAPTGFSVRPGAGDGGSDRVEIIWADNAIQNEWLQVIVKGNDALGGSDANTGLASSDVFFYGNRIGDTFLGSPSTLVTTNAGDEIYARTNTGFLLPITNIADFNKDHFVNAADQIVARTNGGFLTRVIDWVPPSAPDAAPSVATSDGSDSAVAAALTIQRQHETVHSIFSAQVTSPIASPLTHQGTAEPPQSRHLLDYLFVSALEFDSELDSSLDDLLKEVGEQELAT